MIEKQLEEQENRWRAVTSVQHGVSVRMKGMGMVSTAIIVSRNRRYQEVSSSASDHKDEWFEPVGEQFGKA